MNDHSRGRLTIQDLPLILMALGIIGGLTPVLYMVFDQRASDLTTGQAYLIQLLVPSLLIVLMGVIYLTATSGGGR
jgi:hypothetical protein